MRAAWFRGRLAGEAADSAAETAHPTRPDLEPGAGVDPGQPARPVDPTDGDAPGDGDASGDGDAPTAASPSSRSQAAAVRPGFGHPTF